MSKQKAQIGKGIGALLGNIKEEVKNFDQNNTKARNTSVAIEENVVGSISRIALTQISVNPKQPRRDFDKKALQELAESIKLHDVIQPVTVIKLSAKSFQLISGERRFRASKLAGLKDIPAYIRTADNQELLEMALLENLQREDLNAIEIGLSYKQLMDECDLTQEEVAERMKKERSTVANYLRLLKLPPSIQSAVRADEISMGHARAILSLEHIDQQLTAFEEVKNKSLSVRATEAFVKSLKKGKQKSSLAKPSLLGPQYKKIEDDLSSHLSTKVIMDRKNNGKGSILIEFYNDTDLDRILQAMKL
jgi:ParB family transcriptional regulator, chromosome partitioning protein